MVVRRGDHNNRHCSYLSSYLPGYAQTLNRTVSDMFVDISVKPEIRGQMDGPKLARLLTVTHRLVNAFAVKPKQVLLNETDSTENLVELVAGGGDGETDDPSSSRTPAAATAAVTASLEELMRQWIYVKLEVPTVAIDLYYHSSQDQDDHLIFSLLHLNTEVILRSVSFLLFKLPSSLCSMILNS